MSASNTRPIIPPAPETMPVGQERNWLLRIARPLNLLLRRAVPTDVTLNAGDTTTLLVDERISLFAAVHLQATSATAAAAIGLWVEVANGSATIHHDNTADTDRTFTALIIG